MFAGDNYTKADLKHRTIGTACGGADHVCSQEHFVS